MRAFWIAALMFVASMEHAAEAATLQYAATVAGVHAELDVAAVKGKINVRMNPCASPGVKFFLDAKLYGNPEGGCPYDFGGDNFLWDSKTVADGPHVIEARNGDGVTVRAKASFTVANNAAPPPTCATPKPADDTQGISCAPLLGSWTQTRTYTCVAPNWVAGAWLPTSAPAGACTAPLPPLTITVTPTGSQMTKPVGTPITINWQASDVAATCVTDFPGAPTGNPGSTTLPAPGPAIQTAEYRIACVRTADGRPATYFVTIEGEPPALPVITEAPLPACYPTEPNCPFVEQPPPDGHVKVWLVDGPDYVARYRTSYNPGAYAMCVDSFVLTHANADRQWQRCKAKLTAADAAIADDLGQRFLPRFVAVGGAVYVSNADGTLGVPLLRDGAPITVSASEPCLLGRKVTDSGKRYQRVYPAPDAQGYRLPFNAFAECLRQDAPVGGWPP